MRRACMVCGRISDQPRCAAHQLVPRDQARARGYLRQEVIRRDRGIYQICRHPVPPGDEHIDHIIARAHGGSTTLPNLRLACAGCNLRKGTT